MNFHLLLIFFFFPQGVGLHKKVLIISPSSWFFILYPLLLTLPSFALREDLQWSEPVPHLPLGPDQLRLRGAGSHPPWKLPGPFQGESHSTLKLLSPVKSKHCKVKLFFFFFFSSSQSALWIPSGLRSTLNATKRGTTTAPLLTTTLLFTPRLTPHSCGCSE